MPAQNVFFNTNLVDIKIAANITRRHSTGKARAVEFVVTHKDGKIFRRTHSENNIRSMLGRVAGLSADASEGMVKADIYRRRLDDQVLSGEPLDWVAERCVKINRDFQTNQKPLLQRLTLIEAVLAQALAQSIPP